MESLKPLADKVAKGEAVALAEINSCCQAANAFFNHIEAFVGQSDLLGAKKSGQWIIGFAETCHSVLEAYLAHRLFVLSHKSAFGPSWVDPSTFAMAGMQRLVKKYLPDHVTNEVRTKFENSRLSTYEFDNLPPEDGHVVPKWQIVAGVIIGIVLVVASIALALYLPDPSRWQEFVFRGVLSIGLASIAPVVPGFIRLSAKFGSAQTGYFTIIAGGAIAIFVLIWLFTPASVYGNDGEQGGEPDAALQRQLP